MFSYKFCKIFKNLYFKEHPQTAASLFKRKSNSRKTLTKDVPRKMHFVIAKSRVPKRFKRIKNQELPPFGKFVTEVLNFAVASTFFSWNWNLSLTIVPVFILDSFIKNTSQTCSFSWSALFDNLQFWFKLVCFIFCIIIYSLVCQFPLHYYCLDTVIIRSSRLMVFCKKRCP